MTLGRFRIKAVRLITALSVILPLNSYAQLTEQQAVQLGLNNPYFKTQLQARMDMVLGQSQAAGRWDNPSIEYSNETLDLAAGTSEESALWLRQNINIAGVKGLEREAMAAAVQAESEQVKTDKAAWRRQLRQHFYKTIAADKKETVYSQVESRLQTVAEGVKKRAQKGDASLFDQRRIDNELALLSSQSAEVSAESNKYRASLFTLLQANSQPLQGRLLPLASVQDSFDFSQSSQLLALESEHKQHELKARAASRKLWPELTLGVGRKEERDAGFVAEGNMVSIGITLPLFDNGRGEKRLEQNRARHKKAEKKLQHQALELKYLTAVDKYRNYQNAAAAYEPLEQGGGSSLSQMAEASYQAGEISVMALIDAYQSELSRNIQQINTELAARMAYIDIQYLQGE